MFNLIALSALVLTMTARQLYEFVVLSCDKRPQASYTLLATDSSNVSEEYDTCCVMYHKMRTVKPKPRRKRRKLCEVVKRDRKACVEQGNTPKVSHRAFVIWNQANYNKSEDKIAYILRNEALVEILPHSYRSSNYCSDEQATLPASLCGVRSNKNWDKPGFCRKVYAYVQSDVILGYFS